jgi:hypothetical protein
MRVYGGLLYETQASCFHSCSSIIDRRKIMLKKTRIVVMSVTLMILVAGLPISVVVAESTNNFHAHLKGTANVPAYDTSAQGEALFMFSKDANTMHYKITVADIEDVFASHIHCAPAGENGPVGVTLLLLSEPVSSPKGVLVTGTVSEPDPGNQCNWTSLADVENAIRSGDAYVNLHTTAHHSGEIRGQIR